MSIKLLLQCEAHSNLLRTEKLFAVPNFLVRMALAPKKRLNNESHGNRH